jgi:hypothetical protein
MPEHESNASWRSRNKPAVPTFPRQHKQKARMQPNGAKGDVNGDYVHGTAGSRAYGFQGLSMRSKPACPAPQTEKAGTN